MSKSIYKFQIGPVAEISLPLGALIVHVHEQNRAVCIWVLADWRNTVMRELRTFCLIGTGHEIPANRCYHGTAHFPRDGLVLHVFEVAST